MKVNKSGGARRLMALLIAISLTGGSAQVGVAEGNVEQRIAEDHFDDDVGKLAVLHQRPHPVAFIRLRATLVGFVAKGG